MGTYAVVADVKSLFRRIKIEANTGVESTNTVVTIEEVDAFILETEAAINARLATYYVLPAGTESKKILGTITKYKVAQIIRNIMALTQVNSDSVKQDTYNWEKMANDLLNQIAPTKGDRPLVPLPDTSLKSEPPTGSSLFSSSTNTAVFKKNEDNW